jgi:hypothetical protein
MLILAVFSFSLMKLMVLSSDQFLGFLKLSILIIFTKNLELIQFKIRFGSIFVTQLNSKKNCVIFNNLFN